jgi:hypothetical protein
MTLQDFSSAGATRARLAGKGTEALPGRSHRATRRLRHRRSGEISSKLHSGHRRSYCHSSGVKSWSRWPSGSSK